LEKDFSLSKLMEFEPMAWDITFVIISDGEFLNDAWKEKRNTENPQNERKAQTFMYFRKKGI